MVRPPGRGSKDNTLAIPATARGGRSARREQLRLLDHDALATALPLWVGTLPDIDDLLPAAPGMFDLVVLDEASSIDQPLAAPALLRAERAVIVGDPRQLRQVSFVSDERLRTTLAAHEVDPASPVAARLDVRRNSAVDLAAGVAPVTMLSGHFRSDPHLVELVARRLYGGALQVATRTPLTEDVDCVDVVRLEGKRNAKGVVEAEVDHVVAALPEMRRAGVRCVGVVRRSGPRPTRWRPTSSGTWPCDAAAGTSSRPTARAGPTAPPSSSSCSSGRSAAAETWTRSAPDGRFRSKLRSGYAARAMSRSGP